MEGEAGLDIVQVGVEDAFQPAEPVVEGGPRQVGLLGGDGLVAAGVQVDAQDPGEVAAALGVVRQQGAELTFGEGLQAGVVAQQVEQAAQAKVGQAVEGAAVGLPDGYVGDLLGLQEASPYVTDRLDHRTRGEDEGEW